MFKTIINKIKGNTVDSEPVHCYNTIHNNIDDDNNCTDDNAYNADNTEKIINLIDILEFSMYNGIFIDTELVYDFSIASRNIIINDLNNIISNCYKSHDLNTYEHIEIFYNNLINKLILYFINSVYFKDPEYNLLCYICDSLYPINRVISDLGIISNNCLRYIIMNTIENIKQQYCIHNFTNDYIDISPDVSEQITYCTICEYTKK
jgi:hypothetical protein